MVEKKPKKTTEIVVVEDTKLAPIVEGNKYTLVPSWIKEKQVLRMLQRTPKEHRFVRAGKGGRDFEYVTGTYMQKVLNYTFAWNWDFEIVKQEVIGLDTGHGQIITTGKLTVKNSDGSTISKMQNGRADIKYMRANPKQYVDLGNDYKASATDAFKKCASMFGIASDVYGKNEFREIVEPAKETVKPQAPRIDVVMKLISETKSIGKLIELSDLTKKNDMLTAKEKESLQIVIKNKVNELEKAN